MATAAKPERKSCTQKLRTCHKEFLLNTVFRSSNPPALAENFD